MRSETHKGCVKVPRRPDGQVVRHHSFARHILTSKTRSRKRTEHSVVADSTDQLADEYSLLSWGPRSARRIGARTYLSADKFKGRRKTCLE